MRGEINKINFIVHDGKGCFTGFIKSYYKFFYTWIVLAYNRIMSPLAASNFLFTYKLKFEIKIWIV